MMHTSETATSPRVKVRRIVHTIHAVADIAACRARYLDMLGGLIFAEGYFEAEDRDMALLYVADHMALVRLADTKVAFTQPDDPNNGPLGNFLTPPTSGIYALVWRVEDEAMAEHFFHKKGLRTTREDGVSTGFAIDPRDFFNARHEFVQTPSSP